MTQEEKELLLKDLCARLPYRVKVLGPWKKDGPCKLSAIDLTCSRQIRVFEDWFSVEDVRPYLRPISTMTEEEQFQLGRLLGATSYNLLKGEYSSLKELLEYSYKNHIDLFGLIPKGLAIEAPEDMYK